MTALAHSPAHPPSSPDLADFIARARSRLFAEPPGLNEGLELPEHGDHKFSPNLILEKLEAPPKAAAVLIAIVDRRDGPTVLLTLRSSSLRNHSGQIAFPGGRVDPGDTGPLDAALREAEEEIGLARSLVRPLGYLDLYLTGSGYCITPVVALADPGMVLHPNPDEVADVFECPLIFLMDAANHLPESREWKGMMRHYYAMPWKNRRIWGVTAGIIRTLYEKVYG